VTLSPSLSLVVAVYNKPENLRLVFAALARQSLSDADIVIADDGSGPAIAEAVAWARDRYGLNLVHLWHEDRGWRKNTMLNNAIRATRSPYIVFIDGDCIPARRFLEDHFHERERGRVLIGRRVETSPRWAKSFTVERVESGEFERWGWQEVKDALAGRALRVEDGLRMPNRFVRRILLRNVRGMLGSNFSAWKADLEAINGFDELYDGPGCGEDSDLQFRLELAGVTGKSLRNLAVQYHLWHPLTTVSDPCWDRFQAVKLAGNSWCEHGLRPGEDSGGGHR
jgi:glycosyltransferase involved in cell wall biosynthesis